MTLAVFLIGFGQPQSLDELGPFIERVTGRKPSPQTVEAAVERYRIIGGESPLLKITKAQAEQLEKRLEQLNVSARVYVGMRHSPPTIKDAIERAANEFPDRKAVVLTLAAQYSSMSAGEYFKLFDEANAATGANFVAKHVKSYGKHPLFIAAVISRIKRLFNGHGLDANTPFIFSAHSLPAKILQTSDTYVEELKYCMNTVAAEMKLTDYRLAFQSKGGGPFEWLGPSIEEKMEEIHSRGGKRVIVTPIGFVSDHVETLYDIDILAAGKAKELGMEFYRTESLNTSPEFIELLATLVRENIP